MSKNKIWKIIISICLILMIALSIFLILKTNKLQYNIQLITWKDIVDITPSKEQFDLKIFEDNLIESIESNRKSIVSIYWQKNIEIINEEDDMQDTKVETIKSIQWNGIIISNDWYIITNQHVVQDTKINYSVFVENQEIDVNKIWYDEWLDLAIIKVTVTDPLIPAKITNILDEIKIWQIVFALKNDPKTKEIITKMGIINSKNQKFKMENNRVYVWLIQTSTSIEPWFSGGPLININWNVIGMNTAIDNLEYGASYSLPLNQEFINQTISSIKESGKIIRPYIWIKYEQNPLWIKVTQIDKDSPANIAWIELNDIIYGINNNPINYSNFLYQLYTYKPKKNIILNIQRDKFKQDIQVNLWVE